MASPSPRPLSFRAVGGSARRNRSKMQRQELRVDAAAGVRDADFGEVVVEREAHVDRAARRA